MTEPELEALKDKARAGIRLRERIEMLKELLAFWSSAEEVAANPQQRLRSEFNPLGQPFTALTQGANLRIKQIAIGDLQEQIAAAEAEFARL